MFDPDIGMNTKQMTKKGISRHRRSQDFDWGGPNHKSHAMTSSGTLKEEFLWGQRYRRMEDQKPRHGFGS